MAVRAATARREGDLLVPQQSYCIGLGSVIAMAESRLSIYGAHVLIGFDIHRTLMTAVMNEIFYGTIRRGNRYFITISELEYLGVPTDVAVTFYHDIANATRDIISKTIPHPINYTEHGYEFLTPTDVLIVAIPLHQLPRIPVHVD